MVLLHEIIKIVADLQSRGKIALARQIAGEYMEGLDSAELRFLHLSLTASLGETEQAIQLLEAALESDHWFSSWFLMRDMPRVQRVLQASDEKESLYWQSGAAAPIVQVPDHVPSPYPLLIAIHGNGFNAQHSAIHWTCAVGAGWLVVHPIAKRLVGPGCHWWDRHEENLSLMTEQVGSAVQPHEIDPKRVLLGGFSKGGETAMVLALRGQFAAKGFITVGAGGYYHLQPDLWQPLLETAPSGLRGVAMYSPYDLERSGEGRTKTLERLQAAGIQVQMETYCAEGHVFPSDFPERFQRAVEFILPPDRIRKEPNPLP